MLPSGCCIYGGHQFIWLSLSPYLAVLVSEYSWSRASGQYCSFESSKSSVTKEPLCRRADAVSICRVSKTFRWGGVEIKRNQLKYRPHDLTVTHNYKVHPQKFSFASKWDMLKANQTMLSKKSKFITN
ncbi:hypothetical protein TNCV_3542501 [Trichonephila clavipes]|uniref:Uncharacterized protein n=1 Tax=Trichonephila clavipes TaxID=2585209 RepID=A0A8X6S2K9_TRICX|nr:hypothetical protein TNCV_3542501 [Trichonephila clavipes]